MVLQKKGTREVDEQKVEECFSLKIFKIVILTHGSIFICSGFAKLNSKEYFDKMIFACGGKPYNIPRCPTRHLPFALCLGPVGRSAGRILRILGRGMKRKWFCYKRRSIWIGQLLLAPPLFRAEAELRSVIPLPVRSTPLKF